MWQRTENYEEYSSKYAIAQRTYKQQDKEWPRLFIRIYDGNSTGITYRDEAKGYHISVSFKRGREEWVENNYPIPRELMNDVKDMIDELVK